MAVNDLSRAASENYPGLSGELGRSVNGAQERVQTCHSCLAMIAAGDFAEELRHWRGRRAFGAGRVCPCFHRDDAAVRALVTRCGELSQAAVKGNYDPRRYLPTPWRIPHRGPRHQRHPGSGHRSVNLSAEYVDRISQGDLPPLITDTYNGDFNAIKHNLNQCITALARADGRNRHMSHEHDAGDIDAAIDTGRFHGVYGW